MLATELFAVTPEVVLGLAGVLFLIGFLGLLIRRNLFVMLMCVELMLNAVNLTLVAFSRIRGDISGQGIAFFVIALAAAEAAVGLAIVVSLFRSRGSLYADEATLLKH